MKSTLWILLTIGFYLCLLGGCYQSASRDSQTEPEGDIEKDTIRNNDSNGLPNAETDDTKDNVNDTVEDAEEDEPDEQRDVLDDATKPSSCDNCDESEHCVAGFCLSDCDDLPDLIIRKNDHAYLQGVQSYCNVVVAGTLEVEPFDGTDSGVGGELILRATERIEVLPDGLILADGAGYPPDQGPAAGARSLFGGGGGYGGKGGLGCCFPEGIAGNAPPFDIETESRPAYGNETTRRIEMGSGGGNAGTSSVSATSVTSPMLSLAGSGGGAITLVANEIIIDGSISAQGTDGESRSSAMPFISSGAGSGGGVLAIAEKVIVMSGAISVRGGTPPQANVTSGGGGGGGRVKLFAPTGNVTGEIDVSGGEGGTSNGSDQGSPGQDGSLYISFVKN